MAEKRKKIEEKIEKLIGQEIIYKKTFDKEISFKLISKLQCGFFGSVIKAQCIKGDEDIEMDKIYALKFQIISKNNEIDYLREKTILYDLYNLYKKNKGSNYIMKLYGDFELIKYEDNYCVLIMEYCEGISLGNIIKQCNTLKERLNKVLVIKILYQMLETLIFLHNGVHIIHRDIKPDNIILGNDNNIKLLDFGLAVYLAKDSVDEKTSFLVSRKSIKGCKFFVAPEILFNAKTNSKDENLYDYGVDIFSLGFTIYSLMHPKGKGYNLPEITKDNFREKNKENTENDFLVYPPWLIRLVESLYNNDKKKRPKAKEAFELLKKEITVNNIDINQKIYVTYLDNIKNDFPMDILEFLDHNEGRQIKLITSMKCLLQVFNKLDIMEKIQAQINEYKKNEFYDETLLNSFFEVLDISAQYEKNIISDELYNNKISMFINKTFRKNKAKKSGIIPSILYHMLLTTFKEEIVENFPLLYNDIFDDILNMDTFPFDNINIPEEQHKKIMNFIHYYKKNYIGPFIDNFYFIFLKYQQCDVCKHVSIGLFDTQFLPLVIQKSQEQITDLIKDKSNLKCLKKVKCIKCDTFNALFSKREYFLNLPNYLVLELEDKNKVLFEDIINIPLYNEKQIKYEFISCIYKTSENNISKYNALIKKDKDDFEIYSDDNIKTNNNFNLNIECPSLAIYKKIS